MLRVGFCNYLWKPSTSSVSRIQLQFLSTSKIQKSQRQAGDPPKREIRFSETGAYQGIDRQRFDLGKTKWQPDYYSSNQYKQARLFSALASLSVIVLWFGWFREKSDLDDILNAPPHLLSANLERRMLKEEIARAKQAGKDTSLLEAELEYVAVKEAALKVQFDQKKGTNKL